MAPPQTIVESAHDVAGETSFRPFLRQAKKAPVEQMSFRDIAKRSSKEKQADCFMEISAMPTFSEEIEHNNTSFLSCDDIPFVEDDFEEFEDIAWGKQKKAQSDFIPRSPERYPSGLTAAQSNMELNPFNDTQHDKSSMQWKVSSKKPLNKAFEVSKSWQTRPKGVPVPNTSLKQSDDDSAVTESTKYSASSMGSSNCVLFQPGSPRNRDRSKMKKIQDATKSVEPQRGQRRASVNHSSFCADQTESSSPNRTHTHRRQRRSSLGGSNPKEEFRHVPATDEHRQHRRQRRTSMGGNSDARAESTAHEPVKVSRRQRRASLGQTSNTEFLSVPIANKSQPKEQSHVVHRRSENERTDGQSPSLPHRVNSSKLSSDTIDTRKNIKLPSPTPKARTPRSPRRLRRSSLGNRTRSSDAVPPLVAPPLSPTTKAPRRRQRRSSMAGCKVDKDVAPELTVEATQDSFLSSPCHRESSFNGGGDFLGHDSNVSCSLTEKIRLDRKNSGMSSSAHAPGRSESNFSLTIMDLAVENNERKKSSGRSGSHSTSSNLHASHHSASHKRPHRNRRSSLTMAPTHASESKTFEDHSANSTERTSDRRSSPQHSKTSKVGRQGRRHSMAGTQSRVLSSNRADAAEDSLGGMIGVVTKRDYGMSMQSFGTSES